MVSVLVSSTQIVCSSPGGIKSSKTIRLTLAAFSLSMQHVGVRPKPGWFGIRIIWRDMHIYIYIASERE